MCFYRSMIIVTYCYAAYIFFRAIMIAGRDFFMSEFQVLFPSTPI